jgi:hypothetical protein
MRPKPLEHSEDHVEVGDRQECLTPFCPPGYGVMMVALGATAVAAGVDGL